MKKKLLLIAILFLTFAFHGVGKDKIYLKIKEKSKAKNSTFELGLYYMGKRNTELLGFFSDFDIFYKNNQDERVLDYLKKDENYMYNMLDYYSDKITKNCDYDCKSRLMKFYENLYEKTKDIEILTNILKYKEIIGEYEYERIKEIGINNNSIKALNEESKFKNKEIEEKNKNYKIDIDKRRYRVIQEQILNPSSKVLLCADYRNIYLIFIENDKKIIEKIDSYDDEVDSPELKINKSGNLFIINYFRNIYVYGFKDEKFFSIFNGYDDVPLSKYFKYELDKQNINTVVNDDFGYSNIVKVDKLPNEKEIIMETISDDDNVERKLYYTFIIVKDKLLMSVMEDRYIYEVIIDENLKYKLKYINKNQI